MKTKFPKEVYLIPVEWVTLALILISAAGITLGILSFAFPSHSIRLYQSLMRCFHWHAEPLDPEREVRSTRWLGLLMMLVSLAILFFLPRI